ESAYPKPFGSDRSKARKAFGNLSAHDQDAAISGAGQFAQQREAERVERGETSEQSQRFTPNPSRWLIERGWEAFDRKPPDPLVIVKPDQPEFALVEKLRGRSLFVGNRGTATVKQSEINEARRAAERQTA